MLTKFKLFLKKEKKDSSLQMTENLTFEHKVDLTCTPEVCACGLPSG